MRRRRCVSLRRHWPGDSGWPRCSYKDERGRFGLGSFKALGGAYAVANVLRHQVMAARGLKPSQLTRAAVGRSSPTSCGQATVTCATDGNHGRSVAWGAQLFGCRCVIFVHEAVSQGRRDAIAQYGAEVREVKGNYDDAVRHAAATAQAEGWTVVSDTSYPGYRDIPLDVMHGYGVMAAEIAQQMAGQAPPTHVLRAGRRRRAGRGGLRQLLAALGRASTALRGRRADPRRLRLPQPRGRASPVVVGGTLDTVMAGLACGEVSELAWEILRGGANVAVAVDDAYALAGDAHAGAARRPVTRPIVAGETGGVGLAALLAAQDERTGAATRRWHSTHDSRVLLLGSEGDTDPVIYREVVGRTAAGGAGMKARRTAHQRARLLARLDELAAIGVTADGACCRLALTDEDTRRPRPGRAAGCANSGSRCSIDADRQHLRPSRRHRRHLAPVMTGSHIDTVRTGGRYDGNYGVLGRARGGSQR